MLLFSYQFLFMKSIIASFFVTALASTCLLAADAPLAGQVSDAAAKLKAAPNYSWTVTTTTPPDAPFTPPPVKGQTSNGYLRFTTTFGDNTAEVIAKGTKTAFKGEDGWQVAVNGGGFSPDMFALNMSRNGAPAEEAVVILKGIKEVKSLDGGAIGGELTPEAATDLMTFGPHRAANSNPDLPSPKNAKGSAKFWLKDGALVKFQTHLTGTVNFNDTDTALDFTKTTEIQEVGTTKFDVPDDAKKKLESPATAK